ncbi:MAG TPA: family 1 glycosylhydrolase [Abditibacteriaceae bacterium]|jgi:dTDP-4-dehydrorhamnose reductase
MSNSSAVELWGGVECTVNRVGDEYFDQLHHNGHLERLSDFDLFAQLGVRALRVSVLWERTAPDGLQSADWSYPDKVLQRLRELNITPIVGLVHHGSGPRDTSLVDPNFAPRLAQFARAVAERYPWVDHYTPVNEPLTTARFSGQYGHWYPHGTDGLSFAKALITQCRAVALAMSAIREVTPHARLVQTEDLGKTHSTQTLAYQADFENERRWLSFDLLCGRVREGHWMWQYLQWLGLPQQELDWFLENPCPPNIMGINHYLTSERFLDENKEVYPAHTHGGNGRHDYADVEAVRVGKEGADGPMVLLWETWQRYGIPIAVTEAHLGCTREEQMRWLDEVWQSAKTLKRNGVDIRAVTAWTLLGAYDWHCLLTRCEGHYEPGVFDLRGPQPRATALATQLSHYGHGKPFDHPVLASPGWWRRSERLLYKPVPRHRPQMRKAAIPLQPRMRRRPSAPILINGATGTLGRAFARLCDHRALDYRLVSRQDMDVALESSVASLLDEVKPWAVVNTAGYVRVDDAENDCIACFRENTKGAAVLAGACAQRGIRYLTFSSDLVFDGRARRPYVESDPVHPLNVYGQSKAEAEKRVLQEYSEALVARTSAFFGPWDEHNFVIAALRSVARGEIFSAAGDSIISPTYVPDLVHACLDLLIDNEKGVWHLANSGAVTWADLARRAVEKAGLDSALVQSCPTASFCYAAPRPLYSVLSSERGVLLPTWETALDNFFNDCEISWQTSEEVVAEPVVRRARVARS